MTSRAAHLDALRAPADVVVVGGGITGAGVALEAAARGLKVALLEQADFAGGTSSRSTKLIHGGIRYLAQGQIGLVRSSLRQRGELLQTAPELVRPLAFVIPLYRGMRRPLGLGIPAVLRPFTPVGVRIGLRLYDAMAHAPLLRHQPLTVADALARVPDLRTDGLRAAFLYFDAQTDDVRLSHAVLAAARKLGALTVNYCRVDGFLRDGRRIGGVRFEDRLTGQAREVRADHVVNAAGVWAEQIAAMDGRPNFRITPSKGVHLVLRPGAVRLEGALVIPETDDGRLAFLVPWIGGRVMLGTTDDPYDGPLDTPIAAAAERAYLLDHASRYLTHPLSPADVVGAFAGLRPLIAAADASTAALSREHAVVTSPGGLVSIIGGKLTSFQQMARDVLDQLAASTPGAGYRIPAKSVPGTESVPDRNPVPLSRSSGTRYRISAKLVPGTELAAPQPMAGDQWAYLVHHYGAAAFDVVALAADQPENLRRLVDDLPVCAAEVVYACRAEMAVSLADVMMLRARLSLLCADGGRQVVDQVETVMARELGWDAAERTRQRERWERAVERDRAAVAS